MSTVLSICNAEKERLTRIISGRGGGQWNRIIIRIITKASHVYRKIPDLLRCTFDDRFSIITPRRVESSPYTYP